MKNFSQVHTKRVRVFLELYEFITKEMLDFARNTDDLSDLEKLWVFRMVEIFRERFEAWDPVEREYLEHLYESSKQGLFDVAAMAYLHIGFDLPISMDQAKKEVEERTGGDLDPLRCDDIYNRIGRRITDAVKKRWRGPYRIPYFLSRIVDAEGSVFQWVSNHRGRAWANYINIRDANSNMKPLVIDGLHSNSLQNMKDAINIKRTPWGKALELAPPSPLATAVSVGAATVTVGVSIVIVQSGAGILGVADIFNILPSLGILGAGIGVVVAVAVQIFRKREIQKKLGKLDDDD